MKNPLPLEKRIVYEDNHIIVINKLPSEIVQEDKTLDTSLLTTLKQFIKQRDKKPGNVFLEVLHRIDRPVSGLIIFAKTSKALRKFNELLRQNKIEKTYLAIVQNKPPKEKDTLIHYIVKNSKINKSKAYIKEMKNSKKAILSYEIIASSDRYFLLKINLITGRHHQIRSQLSAINCPIKGDIKYGYPRTNPNGFIHLHSYELKFEHPIKKEIIHLKCKPAFEDKLWSKVFEKYI
ncbi:MAG: RluA family pseudouridine synthase [Bacteroidetes bacterium]|nr:MAG: RluA family pseudouridine synthase [Bacteroidota bacterium]